MRRPHAKRIASLAGFCLGIFLCAGCSVPLGPGYSIRKQHLELQFLPLPQPRLAVHAAFELKNSGNRPLQSIRIQLPAAAEFHRASTAARWQNQAVDLQEIASASAAERGDTVELRLSESWAVKQQRTLLLDYELTTGSHVGSFLSVTPETFFADPDSWYPGLLPPKHLFATGGSSPKKWVLTVRVPADYLVHASGLAGKRSTVSGDWVYSFGQQPSNFAPFVAGGKYVETEVYANSQRTLFWTLQPVDPSAAQNAAFSITARARYYESEYGSPTNGDRAIRLLECPRPSEQFGCGALPQTIFVHQYWIARGLTDPGFLEDANFELAYTWFGGATRVRFDESPLPADALAPYVAWEAQAFELGGDARRARIAKLIFDFDKNAAACKEKVILPAPAGFAGCSYSAAWTKSALLYFALEDKIGRAPFHTALKNMLSARSGRDFSLEDLISVVDAEAQQPQGPFFRAWLKHPGIPEDFRARYPISVAPAANSDPNTAKEPQP